MTIKKDGISTFIVPETLFFFKPQSPPYPYNLQQVLNLVRNDFQKGFAKPSFCKAFLG